MPWPANGDYYVFKEEAIKTNAPPVSGVYGLYARQRYVLIGESANVRKALLHHEKETGFRFGLYRPVGFTFEVCPAELRAQRAQELIEEYRPILQRPGLFAFAQSWRRWKNRPVTVAANATPKENPADPIAANQKSNDKSFYFSADQLVVVALAVTVTAVCIGFFSVLTERKSDPRKIVNPEESLVKMPANPPLEGPGSAPGAEVKEGLSSSDALKDGSDAASASEERSKKAKIQEKTAKAEITEPNSVVQENGTTKTDSTSKPAGERSGSLAAAQKKDEISPAAQREKPVKTWTIQVKAAPDKSSADLWAALLKTKGYDAFIVEADINGKTWYRVRVGPFDNRQQAETMRKILDAREGFSDAFLAGNKIADPLLVPKIQ